MDLKNFYSAEWKKSTSSGSYLGDRSWLKKLFEPEKVEALLRGQKVGSEDKEAVALFFADVVYDMQIV